MTDAVSPISVSVFFVYLLKHLQSIKMSRPTKYKDEYTDKVIEFMKQGYSIAEICLELDICRKTFYNWCEENEEFLHAKKKGEDFSEGWWAAQGRKNLENKDFSYTGWYMNMKNRFKWTDRQETTLEGGEKPIQTIDYSKLSTTALQEINNLHESKES